MGRYWNDAGRNPLELINNTLNDKQSRSESQARAGYYQSQSSTLSLEQRKKALAEDTFTFRQLAGAGEMEGARQVLVDRIRAGESAGLDMAETRNLLERFEVNPQDAIAAADRVLESAERFGYVDSGKSLSLKEYERYIEDSQSPDPAISTPALIKLGVKPHAVGNANTTLAAAGPEAVEATADVVQTLSSAGEAGKLGTQLKLKPAVDAAVKRAVGMAEEQVAKAGEERSNSVVLSVYEAGISSLVGALGGTKTGPMLGLLPAVTVNQQVAEGAIAMMAPILKEMFRADGEGTFSDNDQKILMGMIPKRTDHPEVVAAKFEMLDDIVRSRLSTGSVVEVESEDNLLEFMTPEERKLFEAAK